MISIHASRGGSDANSVGIVSQKTFQSTLPAGEATKLQTPTIKQTEFQSTLPAGEATNKPKRLRRCHDFNPRFPRGKRLLLSVLLVAVLIFQSTLPAGEATGSFPNRSRILLISIHASRGGSDAAFFSHSLNNLYFNPRFPRGKRPTWQKPWQ